MTTARELIVQRVGAVQEGYCALPVGLWWAIIDLVEAAEHADRELLPRDYRTGSLASRRLSTAVASVRAAARVLRPASAAGA